MSEPVPAEEAGLLRPAPSPRYAVETEPAPSPRPPRFRALYEIVDTRASGRLVVERHWAYGEAWWRCLQMNEAVA